MPKLSSKTSLTPSDAQKVVIEVSDSEAENAKGNRVFMILRRPRVFIELEFYREISSQTTIDHRVPAGDAAHGVASRLATTIFQLVPGLPGT